MMANSYRLDDTLRLVPLDPDSAAQAVAEDGARIWLDMQDPAPGELEEWLDRLAVSGLARRLCLEAGDHSGFYPLRREILLVFPVLAHTEGPREVDHVAFLCREGLLLTVHRGPVYGPHRLSELQEAEDWLPEASVAALVAAMLIDLSHDGLRHVTNLRRAVLDLDRRMDRDPESVEAEEILDVRSDLLTLGAVVGDQLPSVQALSRTDRPLLRREHTQDFVNCALVNLQAADGALDWLDQQVGSLRSGLEMYAQEKTNRRLGMLTILSAIFMPVTLLAGIWGMNFVKMPELGLSYGYPLGLALMGLVGWIMYRFFRRTGFFD